MSDKTGEQSSETYQLIREFSTAHENPYLAKIREATRDLPDARMQISIEQGRLMALLAQLVGAKKALEVGTYTGYSALCIAQMLPPDGKLIACDISDEWTSIGRPFWKEAGVVDRIDLRLGPASDTLAALIASGESDTFDFAFIDADKITYLDYFEKCLTLVRRGGLIAVDNMFLRGRTADLANTDEDAIVLRKLVEQVKGDSRVDPALVPISDGILLVRKR